MQITWIHCVTSCDDVHNNVVFTNGGILMFGCEKNIYSCIPDKEIRDFHVLEILILSTLCYPWVG